MLAAAAATGLTLTAHGGLGLTIFAAHFLVLVLVLAPRHAAATAFASEANRVKSTVMGEVYEK